MIDISKLKFDENGLIPAVIVDAETGKVLMLAYMNEESLRISIKEGKTCFWSRSRKKLWRKGETSGNVQNILCIKTDCDEDSLVVTVRKEGPACHTGTDSCFFKEVFYVEPEFVRPGERLVEGVKENFTLDTLFDIIEDRKKNRKPGSYTTYLFDKGLDKILKKVGEESTEVIIAAKDGDKRETIYEVADLTYHLMVLMMEMGISPDDIKAELSKRHLGADEKGQEKTS